MTIFRFAGELFHIQYRKMEIACIGTYYKEKALKFNIDTEKNDDLPYTLIVPWDKLEHVKSYHPAMFQLKYRDHFFGIEKEKVNHVQLLTSNQLIADKYGFELTGDPRQLRYLRWVPRKDVVPVTEVSGDYCYMSKGSSGGSIYEIIDRNENMVLLKADSLEMRMIEARRYYMDEKWDEIENGSYTRWFDKDDVYVYDEHDETFRY